MNPWPLGEMDAETFLRDYWQKKPLLIRNAFPDFEPPLDAEELAGMALEEQVESRLITQSADGQDWQLQHGPLSEAQFAQLPKSHWTLLVQAVDHWLPEASELVECFRFVPNWRLDDLMISYAADGGGVGPHYDNYDVFLLQASGTRRWEIGGLYDENSPRRDDLPVMILPEWQAEESFELHPGDMLYLPPRVGHNGYAVGDDCMTCSIGFRAPSHHELFNSFAQFVDDQSGAEDRYTDPNLKLQTNPGEIDADALERIRTLMHRYLSDEDKLADWFGRYMTEPKYADLNAEQSESCSLDEIQDYLEQGIPLSRNEGSRFAYHTTAKSMQLFVDGVAYPCDEQQQALALQLCAELQHSDIANTLANRTLIQSLLRSGSVYWQG